MIRETRDPAEVGAILNDPAVRCHFVGGEREQDYAELLTRAHALVDTGCCIILASVAPGIYGAHLGVLPEHRGRAAATSCREAIAWSWRHLQDAQVLLGSIRADNHPARRLTAQLGFRALGCTDETWHDGATRRIAHYALERPA